MTCFHGLSRVSLVDNTIVIYDVMELPFTSSYYYECQEQKLLVIDCNSDNPVSTYPWAADFIIPKEDLDQYIKDGIGSDDFHNMSQEVAMTVTKTLGAAGLGYRSP